MKDKITVAEDYCLACEAKCTSPDQTDFAHMMVDWDGLTGAWIDRGADPSDIWSFMASVLLAVARSNDISWDDVQGILHLAWKKGEEDDGV